ncbi:MAG: nucleoside deaminase [Fibromonadaceae bacterium]|nr:nucleoside deaminase [Fibromonadaceae bacterium]
MANIKTDSEWMAQALECARAAGANGEVPIGAVVVLNEKQIGCGQNRMEELCSAAAHAEILAINEAGATIKNWRLDGATLYVSLEPCPMCWGAIANSRISRVVFAAADTRGAGCCSSSAQIESGILEKESAEILRFFFRNVRKIKGDSGAKN